MADTRKTRLGLNGRLAILVGVLLVVSFGVIVSMSTTLQHEQAEREMLEKSQLLSKQMNASWEFVEKNQDVIDTDRDGTRNFKGIYCAIAGKSIAARFTQETDYTIRYISQTPRKKKARPDEFESLAYEAFARGAKEYYGTAVYRGDNVFRYVTPLYIEESCLECHGEPAGEIDITGTPKEGLKVGEIGGAISIVMPIDLYLNGIDENATKQIAGVFAVLLISVIIIYLVVYRLVVKPVGQLEAVASSMERGDLNVDLDAVRASGELRDLTERFNSMARRLKASRDELEEQVDNRTQQLVEANRVLQEQRRTLEAMNARLQKESAYKSDFLAIMSHELRTPLTSILAYTELWEERAESKDESEREAVREIRENGQLLLEMVNNILETARSDEVKQRLNLEEVDMVDLFGAVENAVGFIAQKRSIAFSTHVDSDVPIFWGDWSKLRRIVENLTSNALKFTRQGGTVSVRATYDGKADAIVLSVSDNGIGIKKEDLPRIFDRFTQSGNSSQRRYKGSGLGLAVVADLVKAHGGTVEVQSTYQQGSTFMVRIPRERAEEGSQGGGR